MIIGHVEAGLLQKATHAIHERLWPTAEYLAMQEVRCQQFKPCAVDAAMQTRPDMARR
ncbi:hypothetical protein D9M69_700020 [compost metagenome]